MKRFLIIFSVFVLAFFTLAFEAHSGTVRSSGYWASPADFQNRVLTVLHPEGKILNVWTAGGVSLTTPLPVQSGGKIALRYKVPPGVGIFPVKIRYAVAQPALSASFNNSLICQTPAGAGFITEGDSLTGWHLNGGGVQVRGRLSSYFRLDDPLIWFDGRKLSVDFDKPFWFALENTLGISYATISPSGAVDFLNICRPNGNYTGAVDNNGFIFDYNSTTKRIYWSKLGKDYIYLNMPRDVIAGEVMRAVCMWSPDYGMGMYVKIGNRPVRKYFSDSAAAKLPMQMVSPNVTVGSAQAWKHLIPPWDSYANEGRTRNLIVSQGIIDEIDVMDYLKDGVISGS